MVYSVFLRNVDIREQDYRCFSPENYNHRHENLKTYVCIIVGKSNNLCVGLTKAV
jgi:hypothetical protein